MRLVLPGSRADAPGGEDNGLQREWRDREGEEREGEGRKRSSGGERIRWCAGRKSHTQPICNNVPRKT